MTEHDGEKRFWLTKQNICYKKRHLTTNIVRDVGKNERG